MMRTPLQTNEKILLVTYTSWVMLIVPALIILAALTISILLQNLTWGAIFMLTALAYFGWKYLEWKHNIWVVTNFRVIDEFGVLSINTKESPLDKINNVSYQQNIWGRILGFGNVEIQTAATIGETVYSSVDKPRLLKDTITNAQANYKHVQMTMQMKDVMQQMQPQQVPAQPSSTYVSPPPHQGTQVPPSNQHIATELEKLFELRQKGILTNEEYQKAKTKLLGD